jgi:hypothetical protein
VVGPSRRRARERASPSVKQLATLATTVTPSSTPLDLATQQYEQNDGGLLGLLFLTMVCFSYALSPIFQIAGSLVADSEWSQMLGLGLDAINLGLSIITATPCLKGKRMVVLTKHLGRRGPLRCMHFFLAIKVESVFFN